MNSNAAARLPFLKALNTPQTTTAASHSAAGVKVAAGSPGDGTSEFSRMLVRNQNAAALSQRATAPGGRTPPPKRPESPPPTPRTEPASSSAKPADSTASADAATDAVADAEAGNAAATPTVPASERKAATRSPADAPGGSSTVAAAMAEPIDADLDHRVAGAVPAAPTAAELASLAAWGAMPMPPVAPPTPSPTSTPVWAAPAAEGDSGAVAAGASESMPPAAGLPDAVTTAPLPSESAASPEVADAPLATDLESAVRMPADKASLAIDPGVAAATATGGMPDATLAHLATLAAAVRPNAEPELRTGSDLATPPAWAIGAPGASTLARPVDAAAPPWSASVATPLADSGFHEALGMQVSLLAREGIQKAELRLNPADMGPVSVQITMNGDQARVDFGADLAQTRQVIEAGWAELAASLQEAGFTLSGGGVSQHARNRQEAAVVPSRGVDRSAGTEDEPVVSVVAARPRAGAALDLYA